MFLLLSQLAVAQETVQIGIQDAELRPVPQGIRLDVEGGAVGAISAGAQVRVTNWGGVGPSWLYTSAQGSVALWRPELTGNDMGYQLPRFHGEVRVGAIMSRSSMKTHRKELSRENQGFYEEVTWVDVELPTWTHQGVYVAAAGSAGTLVSVAPGIGVVKGKGLGTRVTLDAEGERVLSTAGGTMTYTTVYVAPSSIDTLPVIPGLLWERTRWRMSAKNHAVGTTSTLGLGVVPTRMIDEDIPSDNNTSYVPMPTLRLSMGWTGGTRI